MTPSAPTEAKITVAHTRPKSTAPIRLAIIGCGAIVRSRRLPALAGNRDFSIEYLIDQDSEKLPTLAKQYSAKHTGTHYQEVIGKVDAAFIALPNNLHAPAAIDLARQGIHLCIEKPLAPSSAECERMMDAADAGGCVLTTAFDRRFRPQYQLVSRLLQEKRLGRIERVHIREGNPMGWSGDSGFYFDAQAAGGGVLLDAGIHMLDQLLCWFGTPSALRYQDDSSGGMESDCHLELHFPGEIHGSAEFSRLRPMGHVTRIHGTLGQLEVRMGSGKVKLFGPDGKFQESLGDKESAADPMALGAEGVWGDFADAIRGTAPTQAGARAGKQAVALVERCYQARQPLLQPWDLRSTTHPHADRTEESTGHPLGSAFSRCTVLVTGGSGFIGGRVVELLRREHEARVRVLTRDPRRALRALSTGAEVVQGDMTEKNLIKEAARDCDYIIHCARDDGPGEARLHNTLAGTDALIEAALEARVKGLVNISSMVVYGQPTGPVLREDQPLDAGRSIYARMKAAADQRFLDAFSEYGLPVSTLQPGIVYGPWGGHWTRGQLELLNQRRCILPADSTGHCNLVHVDDVASAILLAACQKAARGKSFLIGGPEPVRWAEFLGAYATMCRKEDALVYLPTSAIKNRLRRRADRRSLLGKVRARLSLISDPYRNCHLPNRALLKTYNYPAIIDSRKARDTLGYAPRIGLQEGMHSTKEWAEYFRVVNGH